MQIPKYITYLLPVKSNSTHYHAGTNLYPNDEDIQILFLVFKPESQHQRLNPSQRGEECFATVESTELQCYKPGCLSLLKINWVGLAYTHLCWGFLATTFLCTSCFPMDLLTVYAFFLLVDNSHALILKVYFNTKHHQHPVLCFPSMKADHALGWDIHCRGSWI